MVDDVGTSVFPNFPLSSRRLVSIILMTELAYLSVCFT